MAVQKNTNAPAKKKKADLINADGTIKYDQIESFDDIDALWEGENVYNISRRFFTVGDVIEIPHEIIPAFRNPEATDADKVNIKTRILSFHGGVRDRDDLQDMVVLEVLKDGILCLGKKEEFGIEELSNLENPPVIEF